MAILIDELTDTTTKLGQRWYIARPLPGPLRWRLRDIIGILTGRYLAVKFAQIEIEKDKAFRNRLHVLDVHDVGKILDKVNEGIAANMAKNTGRNSPCPCGSKRKYKNCCGK